jgi:hypothetical protein
MDLFAYNYRLARPLPITLSRNLSYAHGISPEPVTASVTCMFKSPITRQHSAGMIAVRKTETNRAYASIVLLNGDRYAKCTETASLIVTLTKLTARVLLTMVNCSDTFHARRVKIS